MTEADPGREPDNERLTELRIKASGGVETEVRRLRTRAIECADAVSSRSVRPVPWDKQALDRATNTLSEHAEVLGRELERRVGVWLNAAGPCVHFHPVNPSSWPGRANRYP